MKKIAVVLLVAVQINACSTVGRMFPDNSTDYQRAEALPELEIPPDLSGNAVNSSMRIPNEDSRVYSGQSIPDMPPELPGIPSITVGGDEEEEANEEEEINEAGEESQAQAESQADSPEQDE